MKINGFAFGASLFCFATMGIQPRPDMSDMGYLIVVVVAGILGIISMHLAFEEDK